MKNTLVVLLLSFFSFALPAAVNSTQVATKSYASGNVTTGAYVELIASTSITAGRLQICDTSTQLLRIAIGAAGSEIDITTNQISGCVMVPYYLPAGTRISIKAVSATAATGYNSVSLIP